MELKIGKDLAQAILDYLGTRPYVEVFRMVAGLQQLQGVNPATEPASEDTTVGEDTANGEKTEDAEQPVN